MENSTTVSKGIPVLSEQEVETCARECLQNHYKQLKGQADQQLYVDGFMDGYLWFQQVVVDYARMNGQPHLQTVQREIKSRVPLNPQQNKLYHGGVTDGMFTLYYPMQETLKLFGITF